MAASTSLLLEFVPSRTRCVARLFGAVSAPAQLIFAPTASAIVPSALKGFVGANRSLLQGHIGPFLEPKIPDQYVLSFENYGLDVQEQKVMRWAATLGIIGSLKWFGCFC